jgi:hypothetical protein
MHSVTWVLVSFHLILNASGISSKVQMIDFESEWKVMKIFLSFHRFSFEEIQMPKKWDWISEKWRKCEYKNNSSEKYWNYWKLPEFGQKTLIRMISIQLELSEKEMWKCSWLFTQILIYCIEIILIRVFYPNSGRFNIFHSNYSNKSPKTHIFPFHSFNQKCPLFGHLNFFKWKPMKTLKNTKKS